MTTNAVDLYDLPPSPPCRAVKMTAHLVGVKLNLHSVDLVNKKHLEPEFRKLNPFHKVPVLDDHGFILYESNAIMRYLVSKYAPESALYPQDLQKRAEVDQWMSVASSVFATAIDVMSPLIFNFVEASEEAVRKGRECLEILNSVLESKTFLTGDTITLGDIAVASSLAEFRMACFDMSSYTNVLDYLSRIRSELSPMYGEVNDEAEAMVIGIVKGIKEKINGS